MYQTPCIRHRRVMDIFSRKSRFFVVLRGKFHTINRKQDTEVRRQKKIENKPNFLEESRTQETEAQKKNEKTNPMLKWVI